ncbi:MAG: cadherin-like beta sandwich domain-containing protein [Lachnospiraceae bacterium]
MKKFLRLVLVIMVALTFKIIDVKAEASITKDTFTWSGINNYSSCKLKCTSGITDGDDITSANVLKKANGSVKFKTSKTVTCTIYLSKDLTGNDTDLDIVSRTYSSTPPKTQAPSTTQAPQTTKAQEAPKSNNANIKSLTIKGNDDSDVVLSPVFNPGVYDYEATVASNVKTVSITPILEDAKANAVISNNANEELKAGEDNKITITVTAEDGSKKAYNINIKREALTSDATLKSLEIEEIEKFKFDKEKFTYNVKIDKNIKSLTIIYELSDENSTINIEGNSELKNGSIVKLIVTAQDGTKKVYTLNIIKETNKKKNVTSVTAEKNPLIILGLSMVAFALVGGIIYVIKK